MKTTKKAGTMLSVLVALAMLLGAVGCAEGGASSSAAPEPENPITMTLEEQYYINMPIDLTPVLYEGYSLAETDGLVIKKDGEKVASNPENNTYAFMELGDYSVVYNAVKGSISKFLTLETTIVEDDIQPISLPNIGAFVNNSKNGSTPTSTSLAPTVLDGYELKAENGMILKDVNGKVLAHDVTDYLFATAGRYSVEYTAVKNGSTKTNKKDFVINREEVKFVRFIPAETYEPNTNYNNIAEEDTVGVDFGRFKIYNRFQYETNTIRLNKKGSAMEMSFYGTGFTLTNGVGSGAGTFDMYIDGELKENIDTYNSAAVTEKIVVEVTDLEAGNHTLKIVNTGKNLETGLGGNNVNINYIHIYHPAETYAIETESASGEVEEQVYTGTWAAQDGVMKSTTEGDILNYTYNGIGVKVIVDLSELGDYVAIMVDGKSYSFDCTGTNKGVTVFEIMNTTFEPHTINIENTSGCELIINSFEIIKPVSDVE